MTIEHTPGVLIVATNSSGINRMIISPDRVPCIAETYNDDAPGNARRLVACWNACIGSSTKWLEFQTNPDKVEQFGNEPFETRYSNALRAGLKATEDRAELLKVLRAMVNEPQPLGIDRKTYQDALALIDALAA
jgi:hypothetical protein